MVLRLMSLVLFIFGSMPIVWWIIEGLLDLDLFDLSYYGDQFRIAAMAIVPAICLLLTNRRLVKWVVPLPKLECPKCGYSLQELCEARCPECGLALPKALVSEPGEAPGREPGIHG